MHPRARSKFNKTLREILKIVDNEILTRCKLCKSAELHYDRQIIPERMRHEIRLAEITCEGIRDKKGTLIGNEFVLALFLDMSMGRMVFGGSDVAHVDFDDLKLDRIRSYKAPGFEVMLFQKASELANKYNLGLGDALNLLYAQGEAEFIVTNDKHFLKRWKSNPSVEMETHIQVMKSDDFLNLCKRRDYL